MTYTILYPKPHEPIVTLIPTKRELTQEEKEKLVYAILYLSEPLCNISLTALAKELRRENLSYLADLIVFPY